MYSELLPLSMSRNNKLVPLLDTLTELIRENFKIIGFWSLGPISSGPSNPDHSRNKWNVEIIMTIAGNEMIWNDFEKKWFWFLKSHWESGLHRCWWRMLETKCVGDNFEMLVTVLAVTNILYLSTLQPDINIQKMSPR